MDDCLGNNPIACGKCADVCEKNAINFDDQDEIVVRDVGAIIVAIGLDVYDPTEMDEYGYTRFDNVITSMEFERLINAEGKTRHDYGREKFTEKIWDWKEHSGNTITRQLRRMGASLDWSRERFTMDEGLSDAVKEQYHLSNVMSTLLSFFVFIAFAAFSVPGGLLAS